MILKIAGPPVLFPKWPSALVLGCACTTLIETGQLGDEDRAGAYAQRGLVHQRDGKLGPAVEDYDEAIRLDPKQDEFYALRGGIYLEKEELGRARADFERAIAIAPNYGPYYNFRGATFHREGDIDRAIADYDESIRLYPRVSYVYVDRAVAYSVPSRSWLELRVA